MSNVGWIKLHRKILNWEWYQDANVCRVYLHLLLTANFEERNWKGILINKGDCIFSVDGLSKELELTAQQIRTALNKLKSTKNITILSTSHYHRINIVKYNSFLGEGLNEKDDIWKKQQDRERKSTRLNYSHSQK